MREEQLLNEYYLWLLGLIEYPSIDIENYTDILELMFDMDFTWSIENDANRASDGLNLRYEYVNVEGGYWCESLDLKPVSVLEVLIALAQNWEHEITYDFKLGDRSAEWFWTMIKNLGLLEMTNFEFEPDICVLILKDWLERKFDRYGGGSPFPVKHGRGDQRKVEIWLQLQQFVMENFEI